ncbi:ribonuclease III [Euhalothece natronophila Z-M001]|uniref:Mini-ribonuclease 3 n=1 Tax=Euhalothece natronophila Z-M001 TaxID=522448 RepID=A0A5B8NQI0_9CHRO|nr:ribonuclease III domain-containing protein [Euhalothece natronophila]QDZ41256.1 ribonuclease III [Euhalothece natronophila Z-M001]
MEQPTNPHDGASEAELFVLGEGLENIPPVESLSPAGLAYIGDAVYELYVRLHYLLPPKHISDYHQQVVSKVRAEKQAQQLEALKPHLTDAEKEIVKRGRNATTRPPRRLSAKIYQQATSLETLVGYLFLRDRARLKALLLWLKEYE